jgi:hypothetical protein
MVDRDENAINLVPCTLRAWWLTFRISEVGQILAAVPRNRFMPLIATSPVGHYSRSSHPRYSIWAQYRPGGVAGYLEKKRSRSLLNYVLAMEDDEVGTYG